MQCNETLNFSQKLIPRLTPADELNAYLKSSDLLGHVKVLHLSQIMHIELQNYQSENIFSKQLIDIGDSKFSMYIGCPSRLAAQTFLKVFVS